jgi:hypothetical protein
MKRANRSALLRSSPLLALLLGACREGSDQTASFDRIVPAPGGTQGCWPLAAAPGTVTPVFADPALGPSSQLAAAADGETLYWTGSDGSIHELSFPGPVDAVLVAPGVIEASFLLPDIAAPAELSGITVFDSQFLVVAEHASNTLLAVRRDVPDTVLPLAGAKLAAGGFADGQGGAIRFHFTRPAALLADAAGTVFVCDSENHALRRVVVTGIPAAFTITGSGAPGDAADALVTTELDSPAGIAVSCGGEVLLVESGLAGAGGHRLLRLAIGDESFFGGFEGRAEVLAGDGTNATTGGVDTAAQLATPMGLVSTDAGALFWVDSGAGILRRHDLATGVSDCPLFADCAAAVAAGGSFSGASFSLALGLSGALYVLEGDTGTLYRVDP